ncbi:unnamed protein product [Ilex paraguariensis]|uniref:Uncharacterized protein n=1 Tax=Ilex paraguariensis TaxID=185542 RepID=A0ABC8R3H3_9AQUA
MEKLIVNAEKGGQKKEDHSEENSLSKKLVRKEEPKHVLLLNSRKSQINELCSQELFLKIIHSLDDRIPKRITSFDERYVHRCLELIRNCALRAASCNVYPEMGVCSREISNRVCCDLANLVIECPLAAGAEEFVITSTGDWILGIINESTSMVNILKSPLVYQLGVLDCDVNFRGTSSNFISSSDGFSISSSQKLQKEMVILGHHIYESEPAHKRLVSVSSTTSTCTEQSSSSASVTAFSQGMLQYTWKDGFPHYSFSVDDQREFYVANLFKAESLDDKVVDYMYMFHSRADGKKVRDISEDESYLVGKMRVSTSTTLCPNNSEVIETQFVLFGSDDSCVTEMQTSSHTLRKNKGLPKKMVDVFKTSQSHMKRSLSKFGGSNVIRENFSLEPCHDSHESSPGKANLSDIHSPPNCELAAIVVKDHVHYDHNEAEIGGWGLKFLKKAGINQTNASLETSVPSECCQRNSGDCSTSMEILVPAGFHGGPRTRSGGPSSLIERWNSGGCCDCGGWDTGCPLTLLHNRPSKTQVSPQADILDECKAFDLYIQGSKQGTPVMRMVNIHDGLYYVHFQSSLSALQSFSISVAIIHTHNPNLRPKVYRSCN